MERTTSVDDAVEFDKGDVYSTSDEGNITDEHDYDYDSSDCSVYHNEDPTPCCKLAETDLMVVDSDESVGTTWTDEEHSSYLDSMEASFVRKMYDKEYCSVDVCGYSSNSSVTMEHDCVESHPVYLNMRKPCKQAIGLLPARAFTGSCISTSSVLTSPWIQHFKSKLAVLAKNAGAHESLNGTEQSSPYTSKKREAMFEAAECKPSPRSSHGTPGGVLKKFKCEQDISHMNMKMEELCNVKKQIQDSQQPDKAQAAKTQVLTKPEAGFSEAREPEEDLPELKVKRDKAVDWEIPTSTLKAAISARKCDQLVPFSKDNGKEACRQSVGSDTTLSSEQGHTMRVVPDTTLSFEQGRTVCDMYADKEIDLFSLEEGEKFATQSGSKTWTWDSRGRRQQVGEGTFSVDYKLRT